MRPVHLFMKGFGTFREATDISFDDTELFALVGATGSGKSTVIDAFCFALYGSVPRYGDRRKVGDALSTGGSEAKVSFTFDVGGHRYIATRVVRRDKRGQSTTKEARLEQVLEDGSTDPLVGQERELAPAIKRILGLEFDDFTRCVVLPQGQFAEFLRAKGEDRRSLLVRLLNLSVYERMGQRARQRAEQARAGIEVMQRQLDDLAEATPAARRAADTRVYALVKLSTAVEGSRAQLEQLEIQQAEALRAVAHARMMVEALAKVVIPDAARQVADELGAASAALRKAEASCEKLTSDREALERSADALPEIAQLKVAEEAQRQRQVELERLDELAEELGRKQIALEAAIEAQRAADDLLQLAERADEEAKRTELAQELARTLAIGDLCPVCLHPVQVIAKRRPALQVEKARAALEKARQASQSRRAEREQVQRSTAGLEATVTEVQSRLGTLDEQLALHPDGVEFAQLIEQVEGTLAKVRAARDAEKTGQKRMKEAGALVKTWDATFRKAAEVFDAQRESVLALGPPTAERQNVLADWEALARWAEKQLPVQERACGAAEAEAEECAAASAELLGTLRVQCAEQSVVLRAADDLMRIVAAVAGALATAESELAQIAERLKQAKELERQVGEQREVAQVAAELGKFLRADHFTNWLLAEALEVVVEDASTTLLQLSGGQYSLELDGDAFAVADHGNADEVRSARTLSGGETFQASLALALSLSDHVRNLAAAGAPKLESIFLDEGFGTLDPDSLEVVASTLEGLGSDGRVVGVITHVRELASRMPVRFEVTKGTRTSTVERIAI